MKREYAADTLKWNLTDLLTKEKDRATLDFLCECVDFLLKQPKPDAETGQAVRRANDTGDVRREL